MLQRIVFPVGKKNFAIAFLFILPVLFSVGCAGFVARAGLAEVTGGKGLLTVIKNPPYGQIYKYKYVKIERFGNTVNGILPAGTISILYASCVDELLNDHAPFKLARDNPPANQTLIIRGRIIHYNPAGGLSAVLGKFSQLICRIELVDGATSKVIGQANCIGFSKAILRAGTEELSKEVAHSLRKWLLQLKPPPETD